MGAVPHTAPAARTAGRLAPAFGLLKAGPDSQIGTPVRVFGLVLVLAGLVGALGLFVLGGGAEASAAAPKVIVPYKDRKPAGAAAKKPAARTPAAASAKPAPAPLPEDGLPAAVSNALAKTPIVVVALYAPGSEIAETARAEAEAGAKAARVGFVGVNVLAQKQIEELTATLGVMSDPSVLVFERGGELLARFDGFADSELVAQAATSAARAR
jgi:hypothetical protein